MNCDKLISKAINAKKVSYSFRVSTHILASGSLLACILDNEDNARFTVRSKDTGSNVDVTKYEADFLISHGENVPC